MKKYYNLILIVTFLCIEVSAQTFYAGGNKIKKPKNIIVVIGDGMGFNHVLATNYYLGGKDNLQKYEHFPVKIAMSTYPATTSKKPNDNKEVASGYSPRNAWNNFESLKEYITDSGAAATAMSTGKKTYNSGIGVDNQGINIMHIAEAAKEVGKSVGIVTSVEISHATPAGFSAHNLSRSNYAEIAQEMILRSKCDVIMGAGNPDFDNDGKSRTEKKDYKYVGGQELWNTLVKGDKKYVLDGKEITPADIDNDKKPDYWNLIQTKEEFEKLTMGKTPKRVLGIPQVYETLQQCRSGNGVNVYEEKLTETVPGLEVLASGALNVLDNNKKGFFTMIECGAIDWAAHGNQLNRLIEETISYNKTIEKIIEWVEKNSNWEETLLITTADHETGLLWGENSTGSTINPIVNNGAGKLPGAKFYSKDHSNSLVPFYAKGAGSEIFNLYTDEFDPVRGKFITNSEIAQACFILLSK